VDKIFRELGKFINKKWLPVIILTFALIVPAILGAKRIAIVSGTETFISTDSQAFQDREKFNRYFSSDIILILVKGESLEQLLKPDNLKAIGEIEAKVAANPKITSVVGPAFLIKQIMAFMVGRPVIPDDARKITRMVVNRKTGQARKTYQSVLPDDKHALIAVVVNPGLSDMELEEVIDEVNAVVDQMPLEGMEAVVTGEPVVRVKMDDSIVGSLNQMLLVAFILMLVILALVFNVRNFFMWRWLPLLVVLIGIVYAFGLMGLFGIPMTMVTIAAFPVLIGLGADYAIQFHNRYDEEARKGRSFSEAMVISITRIGPPVGIAIFVACLGFAALFFSPVPMIQSFGVTLIIGVITAYILGLTFLMAVLYWSDHRRRGNAETATADPEPETGQAAMGFVERGLHRLAPLVIKSPGIILPIALAAMIVGLVLDGKIKAESDPMKYMSPELEVIKNILTLEEVFGGLASANVLIEAEDVTDPAVVNWVWQVQMKIRKKAKDRVGSTNSLVNLVIQVSGGKIPKTSDAVKNALKPMPPEIKGNLVSSDFKAANLMVSVKALSGDELKELLKELEDWLQGAPPGVKTTLTGDAVMHEQLISGLTGGRLKMTLIGIVLVFMGLIVCFRFRPFRALMAILPIGLILGWSALVMYSAGILYSPATATLGALIIGIGVEFTVLLMTRYYEERANGREPDQAMTVAMTRIGRAVIASGLTVVGGFGALLIARDFPILQEFGVVTMINIFFALVSTLIVLPPLIVTVDSWWARRIEAQAAADFR